MKYDIIKNFAFKSGKKALKFRTRLIKEKKSDGVDVVTQIDREIEQDFYKLISKEYPEYGFEGEEFPELNKRAEYVWTIDPIDGTKYYVADIPLWAISIALLRNNEPVYGAIYNPVTAQLFEGEKGKGTYLNGKKILLEKQPPIDMLQLSWEVPSYHKMSKKVQGDLLRESNLLTDKFYRMRNIGCATSSLTWLSTGFFGAYLKYSLTEKEKLDNYAGLIIAQESGAYVKRVQVHGLERLIVGEKRVVKQIMKLLDN